MQLTLFHADCSGNKANCTYAHKAVIESADDMEKAVAFDHVCAEYRDNYRNSEKFIVSDVLPMDIDNDHSDKPDDWITKEKVSELFGNYDYVLVPSRNHMKPKDGKSARPKYHIYFRIKETSDADFYKMMKESLQAKYTFFDDNALDAARFMFGSKPAEIIWNEGWMTIDEDIDINDTSDYSAPSTVITQGNRNNTMSRFAGKILTRYGECDKAHEIFMEHAMKCDPPLPDDELNTIWSSAIKFYRKKVKTADGYVDPEEYNNEFGGKEGYLKPEDFSDIGQAKVFSAYYGTELNFTPATDFIKFNGAYWEENKQMAVGAAVEFLDLQLADARDYAKLVAKLLEDKGYPEDKVKRGAKELQKDINPDDIKLLLMLLTAEAYIRFNLKRRDYKYITAMLNITKSMVLRSVSDLDKDPDLLNTPEGTYDLKKGIAGLKEHDSTDLITKITAASPGDEGAEIWDKALQLFFCGDVELIEYVQQVVGLAAIGKVYEEFLIIAHGSGANGKSTFWNAIARVFGTYAGKISSDILTMGNRVNAQPEMAELKGKRLIIASELQEGTRLNTSMVKQLCSTDEIQACKKYKDPFHFIPSHQVVLYTNHLPRVSANDDGIWRRLKVIPFNAKITGNSDVKNYADYLVEDASPAIMKWIIEGAEKVSRNNYKVKDPKCVKEAVDAYREDNNWLQHFLDDCCELGDDLSEKSGDLYQKYRGYCITQGEYTRSTTDFYSAIEQAGFYKKKTATGAIIYGLALKESEDFMK